MKIIQAVHVNGTDKNKRYWKVPDHLKDIKLKKGQEAVVQTEKGLGRVRITHVTNSKDGCIYYTHEDGKRLRIEVTQEVVMFYERDNQAN
ncbi:hypothetical protein ACI1UB_05815 [Lactococcus petauri]|uniref:hypothetical protein n=1 Tax=Lactococcus petauri TaxID=1940789 RepID=UPI0038530755